MTIAVAQEALPDHAVLYNVSWNSYLRLRRETEGQGLRLTFDEGTLEIMSPLPEHEFIKTILDRMLFIVAFELDIGLGSYGSSTLKLKSAQKGLEPDQCYYIANEARMRARKRFDLERDPAPDLVIEVDISYRTVDKRTIYATLGVPEIWSYSDERLTFLHLKRGKYEPRESSLAFPSLRSTDLQRFLDRLDDQTQEMKFLRRWREWVQKELVKR
jgi:Uma2 family endonuclease